MDKEVAKTLRYEVGGAPNGGYTNDPRDPGGETKWGISKRAHKDIDIPNLTLEGATAIYKAEYWDKIFLDSYSYAPFRWKLFDIAVNQGVATATAFIGLLKEKNSAEAVIQLVELQVKRYANKVKQNPTLLVYINGWMNRGFDRGLDLV
jgi:hypothetical protein